MNSETKLILARSYVIQESMTSAQKDTVLASLTTMTETLVFDYWICLGRLKFEMAVDIAKRINDNELLLYALIKQSFYIKNDSNINGEEKSNKINAIQKEIDELKKNYDTSVTEIEKENTQEDTTQQIEVPLVQ